jgi:HK97 family phage major capsid protein
MADELNKELNALIGELRAKADEKDKEIKKLGDASGETKTTMEKMQTELAGIFKRMDELEAKAKAPELGTKDAKAAEFEKQSKDFDAFLRRKDYQISGNTSGGYTVPSLMYDQIIKKEREYDPIRSLARVITVSNGSPIYIPRITTNQTGGFTTETASRAESTAAVFEQRVITPFPVYTQVQATYALLEDSAFDIQGLILDESAKTLAYHEGVSFISGNGSTSPYGILSDAGVLANAEAAGDNVMSADALVKVPFKIKPIYHNGAAYVMSPATMAATVSLKEEATAGSYYFHAEPNAPYKWTLNGYPVLLSDTVADPGDKATIAIFGNFKMGYTIADVAGSLRIIIDPYSQKGVITYHIEKRVGANVVDPDAFAVITTS